MSIRGKTIKFEDSIKVLGIQLGCYLNFDIKRLQSYIGFDERKILVQGIVHSNFNYCPLVWHFCSAKSKHEIERYKNVLFDFIIMMISLRIMNFY